MIDFGLTDGRLKKSGEQLNLIEHLKKYVTNAQEDNFIVIISKSKIMKGTL